MFLILKALNNSFEEALVNGRTFLNNYHNYTANSFYSELESMLNDVKIGENMTETKGNVQLSVSFLNQSEVTYRWTYVDENRLSVMGYGWPNTRIYVADGIGSHFMNGATFYLSTVTSPFYTVSPGYSIPDPELSALWTAVKVLYG